MLAKALTYSSLGLKTSKSRSHQMMLHYDTVGSIFIHDKDISANDMALS